MLNLLASHTSVHVDSTVRINLVSDEKVSVKVDAAARLDRACNVKRSKKIKFTFTPDTS